MHDWSAEAGNPLRWALRQPATRDASAQATMLEIWSACRRRQLEVRSKGEAAARDASARIGWRRIFGGVVLVFAVKALKGTRGMSVRFAAARFEAPVFAGSGVVGVAFALSLGEKSEGMG